MGIVTLEEPDAIFVIAVLGFVLIEKVAVDELLTIKAAAITGQPQTAGLFALARPLAFKSYIASALADALVDE